MITVKYLKEILGQCHDDDRICAYEGEDTGIIIVSARGDEFNRFIPARDTEENQDKED